MTSPARRQYLQMKSQYPDAILFYQVGDFYETFDEDAHIASRVLQIVLTKRSYDKGEEKVPLAGIPLHALDNYVGKLIQQGYKVAICDQVGDVEWPAENNAAPETRPDRPVHVRTSINPDAVRRALEAILASGEVPPPSLREVAERIGQTYVNLRHHLPELSRLISARYRSYQEAQGTRTRARLRDEVRQAATCLHQQGHYPSSNRIAALISSPNSIRSPVAQSARYEVLRELGWRT